MSFFKYAVLGLLAEEGPMHGYALQSVLEQRLGDFWEVNYGQVYQVLTALESDGFVVSSEARVGRRPTRKVHAISAKGRDAQRAWIAGAAPRVKEFRDDFYVRLLFSKGSSPRALDKLIGDQIERCWAHLSELVLQRATPRVSADPFGALVRRLSVEAAILHMDASVRALDLCRAAFERFYAGGDPAALLSESEEPRESPRKRSGGGGRRQ